MAVRLNHRNHAAEGNFRCILVGLSTGKEKMQNECGNCRYDEQDF